MDGHGSMVDLEKRKRHHRILKQLPGPYIFNLMEEARIIEPSVVTEVMNVYSNERRLVLRGLLDHSKSPGRKFSNQKVKRHLRSGGESADKWSVHPSNLPSKYVDTDIEIEELKSSITALLQFPSYILSMDTGLDESQGSAKRSSGSNNRADLSEETPGCEECRRAKRQRLSEERSFDPKLIPTDEEETWWVRKGMKSIESFKGDPPPKYGDIVDSANTDSCDCTRVAEAESCRGDWRDGSRSGEPDDGCDSSEGDLMERRRRCWPLEWLSLFHFKWRRPFPSMPKQ
ncbi:RNA polymerase II transcription mediator [Abeliophyllum distichum]|uniref:RNA polymerase II transcription mediator n=1 Tax=Abeliophyllum distichum TaxID=126358 RepID=A0ABD1TWW7_9LAMI